MTSKAFTEITKLLSITKLGGRSDKFVNDSVDRFVDHFRDLPEAEYAELHNWLNTGNRLADKIDNFTYFYDTALISQDVDISVIVPETNLNNERETIEWIDISYRECVEHYIACNTPVEIMVFAYIEKKQDRTDITYRIITIDSRPMIGIMLWDEKTIYTDDFMVNAFYAFITVRESDNYFFVDGPYSESQKPFKPVPLFKYHPIRYSQSRAYVKDIPESLKSAGITPDEMSIDGLNIVAQSISTATNRKLSQSRLRFRRNNQAQNINSLHSEIECFQMYLEFTRSGRKIFDLNPPLVEMFSDTSVEAIPVSFLTSPFKSYYIHFGKQPQLSTGNGWHIDGAYVQHYPESKHIKFLFTSSPENPADTERWAEKYEPFLNCVISEKQFGLNLGKAVDEVIANRREAMLERISEGDKDQTTELQLVAKEHGEDLSSIGIGTVIDIGATTAQARLEHLENSVNTLKASLSLAVNSMCYLTAYPDDIDLEWASETPRSMVERAAKGHPAIKKNTESKLISTGYQKVYLCGRKITQGPVTEPGEPHGKKRTHWRRFHWRLQAYGPKRSLRKAIIIEAMLINAGAGFEDEPTGTIYIDRNVVNLAAVKKKLKITSPKYWEGLEE